MSDPVPAGTTEDAVLGGRLVLRQPRRGHRAGHDAILLAAATDANAGARAVDLGAGVGAAGLALAARVPGVAVTLVEIDAALVALAAGNIARNGLSARARAVELDIGAPAPLYTAAGLRAGCATHVLMNPPFHDPDRSRGSPEAGRRLAHLATGAGLAPWLRAADRLLGAGGTLTLIWRADGLADVLAALARRFGGIVVMPVHPRPGAPAIRILVRAVKDGRAPPALLCGLVLADPDGRPTAQAEAVLRHGGALALAGQKIMRS